MHRLNTYPLIHIGLIHALINLVALTPLLERFEREIGTFKTLLLILGRMLQSRTVCRKYETDVSDNFLALVTFPGFLYLGIEMFILKGNTVVAGASALVFTLMAAEAIKTYAFHPYYNIAGWEVPSWATPILWVIVAAFLVPASSLIGHFCGLVIGYACTFFAIKYTHIPLTITADASRYLRLIEPSEWILTKVETKLGFLFRRIPHYVSLENRTEMNYWEFLPMTNSMRSTRAGAGLPTSSSAALPAFATAGPGVRLGS